MTVQPGVASHDPGEATNAVGHPGPVVQERVYRMIGGIVAWEAKELPTEDVPTVQA